MIVSSPGRLLPLLHVSVSEGQLVQLSEQIVRNVLLVVVLRPQDELDSLRRRIRGRLVPVAAVPSLAVMPVSTVTVPPPALTTQRDVHADVHGSVT